ncbi:MAG: hypothetical protein HOB55_04185 [Euryarchaeota archaeon]|jgi:ribonuclease HI|nr:hypothetical protein [Euryarchaeota archaeon]
MTVQGLGAVLKILKILEELETEKAQNRGQSQGAEDLINILSSKVPKPIKKSRKKVSSYHRKYSAEFKKLAPKFKKKNGSWKKDGFKRCAAAARKKARR